MRSVIAFAVFCLLCLDVYAQGNRKPKIEGQDALSTNEDESITILMSHLDVEDADDWFYPWGFTMTVYSGSNYSLQGHIVIPAPNFHGVLKVPVTVHDGQDESNRFDLQITVNPVNDKPVITGHASVSTNENQAVTLQAGHLTVTDPDNSYPADFTLAILPGNNYSANGYTITPQSGFSGTLSVNVTVSDGQTSSAPYALPVEVKPVNRVPEITGQATLQVSEDQPLTISFSHLTVVDNDSNYPQGFTINLSSGENYTISNTTITPLADFYGRITVPATVNDGKNTSKPFNLIVTVTPVNDIPRITDIETEPLFYSAGDLSVVISEALKVSDPDGDSIMFAEVGFRQEGYQITADKLMYTPTANKNIRAVFDQDKGVLTLLGQASPASYTAALKSVSFQTIGPSSGTKVLYILANDGKSESETVERTLQFGRAAVALEIPTGFTPNGDLANDTWKIVPLKSEEVYSEARIRVYNKMGVVVYESIGFEREWDGRLNGELLPADTYFYTIDLNTDTPEGFVKGLVTILR
jgi:gliding motility-associated-like protein